MRVEVAVVAAEFAQPLAQHHEVAGLVVGHLHPVAMEVRRQAAEAVDGIPCQVDGIELDVGDGMQERGAALVAAEAAARQVARMHQPRPRRPARHADRVRRRCVGGNAQLATRERGGMLSRQCGFLRRICGVQALAGCSEDRVHGVPPLRRGSGLPGQEARRLRLASSERICWMRSK